MSHTQYWDVNDSYWSDEDEDLEDVENSTEDDFRDEPVRDSNSYYDYGSEIDSSRPAAGERDII